MIEFYKNGGRLIDKLLDFLDTANFTVMRKSLDIMTQRLTLIGQNVANVNTPQYKAKKIVFEDILQQEFDRVNSSYALRMRYSGEENRQKLTELIETVTPQVYTDDSTETRVDGNNVDIDHENLELAKVQLQYNYMLRKITDEYNLLKYAITEGRG